MTVAEEVGRDCVVGFRRLALSLRHSSTSPISEQISIPLSRNDCRRRWTGAPGSHQRTWDEKDGRSPQLLLAFAISGSGRKRPGLKEGLRTGRETAGPSTTLRFGRDDNSVAGEWSQSDQRNGCLWPHRIVIPTGAQRSGGTCGFSSRSHSALSAARLLPSLGILPTHVHRVIQVQQQTFASIE